MGSEMRVHVFFLGGLEEEAAENCEGSKILPYLQANTECILPTPHPQFVC